MKFLMILIYIIGIIISWFIFYYVVKAAVRNGIKEALPDKINSTTFRENPANPEQIKLQQRYNNGEISFEVYQTEWNKLKT